MSTALAPYRSRQVSSMPEHKDIYTALNKDMPLREKLVCTHEAVIKLFPCVARIAVAIYDPDTTVLKTYLHSSGDTNPLDNYQVLLDDAPSLKEVLKQGQPRVINNMLTFEDAKHEHTRRIGRAGYAASYTMPMFNNGVFFGFVFFNAYETDSFTPEVLHELDPIGHMISLMLINELESVHTLSAAIRTTGHITHLRDPETGSHMDRMSRFSRLIAASLADEYELDDDYIEHIFMFSPLHDIGKIGIPDKILLKPGKLTEQEARVMRTHTRVGQEIIDDLLENFALNSLAHADVLRNIAAYHHEAVNGSGYPEGRSGDQIPLEARIVAVADVFDALTSRRAYKEAWSNERAFEALKELAGQKLDSKCVDALVRKRDEVEKIQQQFKEDSLG